MNAGVDALTETFNNITEMGNEISSFFSMNVLIAVFIKIGLCIAVILAAAVIIRILKACIKKLVYSHKTFSERKSKTLYTVCISVARYLVYFLAFCQILSIFGINVASFIAVAGVGSVAIAFGAQSLVQDIITGMFILAEDQFGVGDVITVEGCTGTVESIGIRSTRIRSSDGNLFIVPNGQVKIVTNMSKEFNRAVVDVGVAYESDVDMVIDILEDELLKVFENNSVKGLLKRPDVLGVVELGDSAVVIRITADSAIGENWAIERELRRIIKKRLDKEGVTIPYPQRVVHIASQSGVEK